MDRRRVLRDDLQTKLVACIGFGIDAYHGVCHAHFLENVAALTAAGAFLGAFSVLPAMPEGQAFLDAVAFAQAQTPHRQSIVNGSIAAAISGRFGDVPITARTRGSQLFINPLMTLCFTFELAGLADASLYLPMLEGTRRRSRSPRASRRSAGTSRQGRGRQSRTDNGHARGWAEPARAGRTRVKRLPRLSSLSTRTLPP